MVCGFCHHLLGRGASSPNVRLMIFLRPLRKIDIYQVVSYQNFVFPHEVSDLTTVFFFFCYINKLFRCVLKWCNVCRLVNEALFCFVSGKGYLQSGHSEVKRFLSMRKTSKAMSVSKDSGLDVTKEWNKRWVRHVLLTFMIQNCLSQRVKRTDQNSKLRHLIGAGRIWLVANLSWDVSANR
mgnify:CR=1 FL=1